MCAGSHPASCATVADDSQDEVAPKRATSSFHNGEGALGFLAHGWASRRRIRFRASPIPASAFTPARDTARSGNPTNPCSAVPLGSSGDTVRPHPACSAQRPAMNSVANRHAAGTPTEDGHKAIGSPCSFSGLLLIVCIVALGEQSVDGSFDVANLRVLVVDDDPMMTALIEFLLRDHNVARINAINEGSAALEHLSAQTTDLLICDLNMPGMDGVQLMNRIASLDRRPAIILLSGEDPRILDSSRQFAEAKRLTVIGVLRKPVVRGALIELLSRYRPDLGRNDHERPQADLDADDLMGGLGSGALHLFYQPKIDLRSGVLVGVESLLRWNDPVHGSVSPSRIVSTAERHGLIDELTLAVLARSARDRSSAIAQGLATNFAINLSLRNLKEADIVERMHGTVTDARSEPSDFTLEITETHLVDDIAGVLEALIRLRLLGFKIALDDYGTGASTMQMLSRFPSTELKIDRSFVAAAPLSTQGRAFLQSAIELGLQMGQSVVAEGIETENERALAFELGCQVGQGYLFAKPLPLEALLAWADEHCRKPVPVPGGS